MLCLVLVLVSACGFALRDSAQLSAKVFVQSTEPGARLLYLLNNHLREKSRISTREQADLIVHLAAPRWQMQLLTVSDSGRGQLLRLRQSYRIEDRNGKSVLGEQSFELDRMIQLDDAQLLASETRADSLKHEMLSGVVERISRDLYLVNLRLEQTR